MKNHLFLSMLIAILLIACGQGIKEQPNPDQTNETVTEDQHSSGVDSSNTSEETEQTDEEEINSEEVSTTTDAEEKTANNESLTGLEVHYIDVGQADATLLQFEEFTILFDTGDWRGNQVVNYLQSQHVSTLDLVIVSHPDADHVGQLEDVVQTFDVGEVWMSGNESTSKTFQNALEAVLTSGADYYEPRTGESFEMGNMNIEVIYPDKITGKTNEESISALFTYGDVKFLFTGDADTNSERRMMNVGINLDADILQLGHHGSSTSSDPSFIEAVSPDVAIYSAGADNSYGHPHAEVVSHIQNLGIKLFGTDVHGTIIIETDGKEYDILTNKDGTISPKSNHSATNTNETTEKEEKSNQSSNPSGSCVNINSASVEEVQQIKHIGTVRAEELIEKRPYKSVDGLSAINGIGPARIQDIKDEGIACVE
ncbi:MBL fold metallo-hydrolase [Ornithinibacillus sp. L9]|uniref:MBL fold metallo-hydrolase n=1 Tax=Ornithinibacillus caprae TaxID=2678566 RepID=A0A6N8FHH1_9BACI|nr:MBL fold metallo-hydrolase [Ornithinibacillus caprae]MUK87704.1 MBL fold metallo-hydrolase [Ornithinibacillus caprae]